MDILPYMKHAYKDKYPDMDETLFYADSAEIAGEVYAGKDTSFWYNVTVRADVAPIFIGEGTNIQDGSVLHVDRNVPCRVGSFVTVGHGVILHACTIGDTCLIGMGAIVLDGAEIAEESIVGAGALVTQNKKFPPRSLIIGSPARAIRQLTDDEVEGLKKHAVSYIELARTFAG